MTSSRPSFLSHLALSVLFFVFLAGKSFARPRLSPLSLNSLTDQCQFIDDNEVDALLNATISLLEHLNAKDQECASLLSGTRALLKEHVLYVEKERQRLALAHSNKAVLEKFLAENPNLDSSTRYEAYQGLLRALQDINELKKDVSKGLSYELGVRHQALQNTLSMGSTLLTELRSNPQCEKELGPGLLTSSMALMGSGISAVVPQMGLGLASLVGGVLNFLTDASLLLAQKLKPSRRSLKALIRRENYQKVVKCGYKNIEDLMCNLEERERLLDQRQTLSSLDYPEHLRHATLKDLKREKRRLDPNGELQRFLDLKRHRYRLTLVIDALAKIHESADTGQALLGVVEIENLLGQLKRAAKLPPLLNADFQKLAKENGIPTEPGTTWSKWNQNEIPWRHWIGRYFNDGSIKKWFRINCKAADAKVFKQIDIHIWNQIQNECQIWDLSTDKLIRPVLKEVIAPTLVSLYQELARLKEKLATTTTYQSLYQTLVNQETLKQNRDIREFPLSKLLLAYQEHAGEYQSGALKFYAENLADIVKALKHLSESRGDKKTFELAVDKAFKAIALISSDRAGDSVLYRPIIDSKLKAYLDGVEEIYLYTQNEQAITFVRFNFLDRLEEDLEARGGLGDQSGSGNLKMIADIKKSFVKTFKKDIKKGLKDELKFYKKSKGQNARGVAHSCALFYPLLGDGVPDGLKRLRKDCDKVLRESQGLSLLRGGKKKYPLHPNGAPGYRERCYYRDYQRKVMVERIPLFNDRDI